MKSNVLCMMLAATISVSCQTSNQVAEHDDNAKEPLSERFLKKFVFHTHREHLERDREEQKASRLKMVEADKLNQKKQVTPEASPK